MSARRTASDIAEAVVASFDQCRDSRLRDVMQALVRHLHAFAQEVQLTPAEWSRAIDALTASGRLTDTDRNEFVLWSDALGLSMAVDALEDTRHPSATESTVEGPFHAPGSPEREHGASISEHSGGMPLWMSGRVLSVSGRPIPDAELDVWQNGPNRLYAVQDPTSSEHHLRGRFRTGSDGAYAFLAVRPTPYPIPYDGPVGRLLKATGRHPWRPAHIHVAVSARGYRSVVTHVFDTDSDYLDSDAVFAVKPSLVREFRTHDPDDPERPQGISGPWVSVEMDFVLDAAPPDR